MVYKGLWEHCISFVAPTTRPGMVLPTMPKSLLNSTERAKEKMLDITMDICGGRGGGGELVRRLEAWLCASDSDVCGSWTMEQSQSGSCSLRLSTYSDSMDELAGFGFRTAALLYCLSHGGAQDVSL